MLFHQFSIYFPAKTYFFKHYFLYFNCYRCIVLIEYMNYYTICLEAYSIELIVMKGLANVLFEATSQFKEYQISEQGILHIKRLLRYVP